jgi:hypothetical protein
LVVSSVASDKEALRKAERALQAIRREVTDPGAQDPEVWQSAYLKGWHTIADHVLLILDNYYGSDDDDG